MVATKGTLVDGDISAKFGDLSTLSKNEELLNCRESQTILKNNSYFAFGTTLLSSIFKCQH